MAETSNGKTQLERYAAIVRDVGIPATFAFLLLLWLPPMRDAIRDLSNVLARATETLQRLTIQQERSAETQRQFAEDLRTHRMFSERPELRAAPQPAPHVSGP